MKTVDITTTQNVTISYELAVLWERMVAFIIDMVILFFVFWAMGVAITSTFDGVQRSFAIYIFSVIFTFFLYFILTGAFLNGQTIGKKIMNIRIMKINGQELQFGDFLIRELFLGVEVIFTAGALGALLIGASDRNQRMGDVLANTVVVKLKPSHYVSLNGLLSLKTPDNYSPTYPEVTKLKEDDLVLVKQTIDRAGEFSNSAHKQCVDDLADSIEQKLGIQRKENNALDFLKMLSRDYVVLTR